MKKILLALVLVSSLTLSAMAAGPDSDGCGLGWQVTDKKTMSATTTRGTTNSIVPSTFGMTSGTLGCASHPIAKNEISAAQYAFNNFQPLSMEMAEGRGEYLVGFAKIMGCSDSVIPAFTQVTQDNYRSIVSGQDGFDMFDQVKAQIKSHPALALGCSIG